MYLLGIVEDIMDYDKDNLFDAWIHFNTTQLFGENNVKRVKIMEYKNTVSLLVYTILCRWQSNFIKHIQERAFRIAYSNVDYRCCHKCKHNSTSCCNNKLCHKLSISTIVKHLDEI